MYVSIMRALETCLVALWAVLKGWMESMSWSLGLSLHPILEETFSNVAFFCNCSSCWGSSSNLVGEKLVRSAYVATSTFVCLLVGFVNISNTLLWNDFVFSLILISHTLNKGTSFDLPYNFFMEYKLKHSSLVYKVVPSLTVQCSEANRSFNSI